MVVTMSEEEYLEGSMVGSEGVCIECGNQQYGVEPDAEQYRCQDCGHMSVYGFEQALLLGYIQIEEE